MICFLFHLCFLVVQVGIQPMSIHLKQDLKSKSFFWVSFIIYLFIYFQYLLNYLSPCCIHLWNTRLLKQLGAFHPFHPRDPSVWLPLPMTLSLTSSAPCRSQHFFPHLDDLKQCLGEVSAAGPTLHHLGSHPHREHFMGFGQIQSSQHRSNMNYHLFTF